MPRLTIADLEVRTDNQRANLDGLQANFDDLQGRIDQIQADVGIVEDNNRGLHYDLDSVRSTVTELAQQITDLDSDFESFLTETRLTDMINRAVDRRMSDVVAEISAQYNQTAETAPEAPSNAVYYTNIPRYSPTVQRGSIIIHDGLPEEGDTP